MRCVTERICLSKKDIQKNSRGGKVEPARKIIGEAVEVPGEAVLCRMLSRLLQEVKEHDHIDDS